MEMKKMKFIAMVFVFGIAYISCKEKSQEMKNETITIASESTAIKGTQFGNTTDGKAVEKYTLTNAKGMTMDVITYGGIITSLNAPDNKGMYSNVVLGFDSLTQYIRNNPYFGAIIGRYGNRIANGKFSLDGKEYTIPTNDGPNHLHGGTQGFDKVVWTVASVDKSSIALTYLSKDMEMGYPGNLNCKVTYKLTDDNALEISYEATTDKKTIVNLTQHSYFNLSGDFSKTILDHEVTIAADKYLPVNATLIPTGELKDVTKTPFDFRTAKTIGKDIATKDDQLTKGKGYDHCWVLNDSGMRSVSTVHHAGTGRVMEVMTDEPSIQFYTGNFLDGTLASFGNKGKYGHRSGFCLETQHYPDSPNQKSFPSVVLEPGKTYKTSTIYKFSNK